MYKRNKGYCDIDKEYINIIPDKNNIMLMDNSINQSRDLKFSSFEKYINIVKDDKIYPKKLIIYQKNSYLELKIDEIIFKGLFYSILCNFNIINEEINKSYYGEVVYYKRNNKIFGKFINENNDIDVLNSIEILNQIFLFID